MSVPFSNTTLRIPRGFGTLLEGLSREVLREQPRDIIEFAAEYFEDLLKIRTDSGIDPADWAAQLEDRFYNNHVFKEKQTPKPENEPKSAPVPVDTVHQEKGEDVLDQPQHVKGLRKICIKKPDQQTVSTMHQDEEWLSKQPGVSGLTDKTTSRIIEPKEVPLEEKSQVLTGAALEQDPLDDTVSKAPAEATMEDTTSQLTGAGTEVGLLEDAPTQVTGATPAASSLAMTDIQEISATSEQGQMEGTASGVIAATLEKIHQKNSASSMMLAPSKTVSEEDTAPQMITTASAVGQEENIEELPTDEEWLSKQPGVSGLTDKTTPRLIEPNEEPLEEKSQVLTGAALEQDPLDDTVSKAPVEATMEDTTLQLTGAGTEGGLLVGTNSEVIIVVQPAGSLEVTDTQVISTTSEGQLEGTTSEVIAATPEAAIFKKSASSMMSAPSEAVSKEDIASQIIITTSADGQEEKIQTTDELPWNTSKNEDHAAAVIQSVYRGYSTRKKLKENASSYPETDDDLFTEACPRPNGIRNSSGEELAVSEGENINFENALAMTGEKTKSRMGVDGLHTTAKNGTTEISICAAELGSPLVKENINTDADICGAELQSVMKEDNKSEMAGYNICGTELDQKDFSEAPSSSTVNVDICGTELGFVVGKDAGREDNKSNETDIKPQDEPAVKVTEEAPHQQEVSGVLNDRED
ncbi:sperm surface protein Sp17 [Hypanus sabinus]|uniref:sperm surface protein Sp17 n=1 Tax=Hypanus sabinus TaxID=79690 RepID=UPI0028C4B245|nr:sperm surface protein Sp17 [Hypanus sabinus]